MTEACRILKKQLNALFDKNKENFIAPKTEKQKVFVSVCEKNRHAPTFCSIGNTVETAFRNARDRALKHFSSVAFAPDWIHVAFVSNETKLTASEFCSDYTAVKRKHYIGGVSFDEMYRFAFLKQETSGVVLADYAHMGTPSFNDANITDFLRFKGIIDSKVEFSSKPITYVIAFECKSCGFCKGDFFSENGICEESFRSPQEYEAGFLNFVLSDERKLDIFKEKRAALRDVITGDNMSGPSFVDENVTVVFLSVCDTERRAKVFRSGGKGWEEAWTGVADKAEEYIRITSFLSVWIKADIVMDREAISYEHLRAELSKCVHGNPGAYFYPYGIAFDGNFEMTLLSEEFNGCGVWDFRSRKNAFIEERLFQYLAEKNAGLREIPHRLMKFKCRGFVADENRTVFALQYNDGDYGKRVVSLNKDSVSNLIERCADFLMRNLKDDGSFVYGYISSNQDTLTNYNILRHAGTALSIMQHRNLLREISPVPLEDKASADVIEKANRFLIKNIVKKDENISYVADKDEIKLGGNGLGVVALVSYSEFFGMSPHNELVKMLANGILSMQEPDGSYYHVLNAKDFSRKERIRTVYYDGEASYALVKAYALTGDKIYLDAAEKAVKYFMENGYERYRDHWVAYTLNELTKHVPKQEYFNFALKNAQDNLVAIFEQKTPYHTYFELLMATFNTFRRLRDLCGKETGTGLCIPEFFDETDLARTIWKRATYMLNFYFYPESAMYMKTPRKIAYTFNVRHWDWRVRIDDLQHFIGGYYEFYRNYEALEAYLDGYGTDEQGIAGFLSGFSGMRDLQSVFTSAELCNSYSCLAFSMEKNAVVYASGDPNRKITGGLGFPLLLYHILALINKFKISYADDVIVDIYGANERRRENSLGLSENESVKLFTLFCAATARCAPDATVALSRHIFNTVGKGKTKTVSELKKIARSWGIDDESVKNPTGRNYEQNPQYFTAEALLLVARELLSFDVQNQLMQNSVVYKDKYIRSDSILVTCRNIVRYLCFGEGENLHAIALAEFEDETLYIAVCGANTAVERDAAVLEAVHRARYPVTLMKIGLTQENPCSRCAAILTAANDTPNGEKSVVYSLGNFVFNTT
jgi:hypothetical protein